MLENKQFFIRKTKQQVKEEAEEYERWAFPHGAPQREKLEKLLLEVLPKESLATALIPFLTCKELFENDLKRYGTTLEAINSMINVRKKYKSILKKKQMPIFVALVVADAALDPENLDYPPAEEILALAAEYEKLREPA